FSITAQGVVPLSYLLASVGLKVSTLVRSGAFWNATLAASVVLIGYLPWVPYFMRQRHQVQDDFWTRPIDAWDVPHLCYRMFVDPHDAVFPNEEALLIAVLCGTG